MDKAQKERLKIEKKATFVSKRFKTEYEAALQKEWVRKPVAYALYQTWKYYNTYEHERNTE